MTLYSEIGEQPAVLRHVLDTQWPAVEAAAATIREHGIRSVFLAARGTSGHAGLYGQYLWGMHNRMVVALAAPSMFTRYNAAPDLSGTLVVGISQSGQSPDIVEVIAEGARQGALTLSITNAPDSPLAQASAIALDVHAGAERAVAATKSYTAQLLITAMLSVALDDPNGERRAALERLPDAVAQALGSEEAVAAQAARLKGIDRCLVIGRGYNLATTLEWALKLKEMAYVAADPYSSAEFQHGPAALVEPGLAVLAAAPQDAVFPDVLALLERLRSQGAEIVTLSDHENVPGARVALPAVADWLSPITAIVPAQLFAYHLTLARGIDPAAPRGLSKVTLTE